MQHNKRRIKGKGCDMRLTKKIVLVACAVTIYLTIDRGGLYMVANIIAVVTAALIVTSENTGGNKI